MSPLNLTNNGKTKRRRHIGNSLDEAFRGFIIPIHSTYLQPAANHHNMRRGKQKVRMSTSVTEIDADNSVKVRKTKRKSAGRRPAEKDPLALPKRKPKAVPTKAARKQPAQPEEYEVSR